MTLWNSEEINFLVNNYGSLSILEMSNKLNRSYSSVKHKCCRLGLSSNSAPIKLWEENELNYLITNYSIINPNELVTHLNRNYSAIVQKANSLGLKMLHKHHTPKYDESFLDEWSPELAWMVGIVLSDGCVSNPKIGLYITISMMDEDVLIKLKDNCNSISNIRSFKNKTTHMFITEFRGKKIYDFFNNLGIVYNKTHIAKFPIGVPGEYIIHVIRGIFDGDGSICLNKNRNGYPRAKICGTFDVINYVNNYFNIHSNIYKKHNTTYDIQYSGSNAVKFLEHIYNNSTYNTRMDRKYDKYLCALNWQKHVMNKI